MRKIVIHGFGRIGKELFKLVNSKSGCELSYIIDRNAGVISYYNGSYEGVRICSPSEAQSLDNSDKEIIIALSGESAFNEAYETVKEHGFKKIYSLSRAMSVLCDTQCDTFNCLSCCMLEKCPAVHEHNKNKAISDGYTGSFETCINMMILCITKKCTLNCVGCCGCIDEVNKIKGPKEMSLEQTKKYFGIILSKIDYIGHIQLNGGEALLHPELSEIIDFLCSQPQIGFVKLLTNSTVKFGDRLLECLKRNNNRVHVCLDNYGEKIPAAFQKITEDNIRYFEGRDDIAFSVIDNSKGTWYDFGPFEPVSKEQAKINNKTCVGRNCLSLYPGGILSWCDRITTAVLYGFIPVPKEEYFDANNDDPEKIIDLLNLEYLHGCEFCKGSHDSNIIESGIQHQK